MKGHATSLIEAVCCDEVAADVAAQHGEGKPGGARRVAVGHARVAVLLDLERAGPAVLHRVAEAVQAADARVAAPGEDEPAGAAHPDHLVVDDVRGQAHEREVAPPLPDDLVACRGRDQMRESLECDGVAVLDEIRDRVLERGDLHGCDGS